MEREALFDGAGLTIGICIGSLCWEFMGGVLGTQSWALWKAAICYAFRLSRYSDDEQFLFLSIQTLKRTGDDDRVPSILHTSIRLPRCR